MKIEEKFSEIEQDCVRLVTHYNSVRNYNMAHIAQSVLTTIGGFNQQLAVSEEPDEEFPEE